MKNSKKIAFIILIVILSIVFPLTSFAHSGRTDSSGGHKDNKNKSGLGSYHYHHGMSAHLHPGGVCPYGDGSSESSSTATATPSPSIKVSNISTTMNVGDVGGFDVKIENTSDNNIKVTSSNTDVIYVNADKTLSAKGVGTSTITIGNDTVSQSFTITVKEVFATDLEILTTEDKLQLGVSLNIKAEIIPSNTTNKNITYKSSDESVATVSEDGVVEGLSVGEAKITVSTSNDISKEIDLTVFEVFPETIECDNSINLIVGDSQDFEVNILPENSNNKNFTVSCENEDILQYSNNKVIAIKEGNTSLIIETWNGIKKTIPIEINKIPVESVEIIDLTTYMFSNVIDLSDEIILETEILPYSATYQDITWHSSNSNIVSIDNNNFSVNGIGKVVLTCNTPENVSDNIEIIVINKNMILLLSISGVSIITCSTIFAVQYKKKKNKPQ